MVRVARKENSLDWLSLYPGENEFLEPSVDLVQLSRVISNRTKVPTYFDMSSEVLNLDDFFRERENYEAVASDQWAAENRALRALDADLPEPYDKSHLVRNRLAGVVYKEDDGSTFSDGHRGGFWRLKLTYVEKLFKGLLDVESNVFVRTKRTYRDIFVSEYVKDYNAVQTLIRMGFDFEYAVRIAPLVLKNPGVAYKLSQIESGENSEDMDDLKMIINSLRRVILTGNPASVVQANIALARVKGFLSEKNQGASEVDLSKMLSGFADAAYQRTFVN